MQTSPQQTHRNSILLMLAIVFLALAGIPASASAPAAGQQIDNEASIIYQDSSTGLVSKLKSNVVRLSVSLQEAILLTQDHSVVIAPGTPVSFSHRLVNAGNNPTSFAINAANASGDDYDLQQVTAYLDTNSNGSVDPGEPVIPSGGPVSLAAGESASIILTAVVPAGIAAGQSAQLTISAISAVQSISASNSDTVATTSAASVQLTKTASNLAPRPNDEVTFTLTLINSGNSAAGLVSAMVDGSSASLIVVRDALPANTTFAGMVNSGGGIGLYHLRGRPSAEYDSSAPADLTQVDAVGFGFPALGVGQAASGAFKVRINDNASGPIFNVAQALFHDGTTDKTTDSNRVQLSVPVTGPAIRFYTDTTYAKFASVGRAGAPVFVQANAAGCNLDPNVAETHEIRVSSLKTGDTEVFSAVEIAANSGIFRILPNVPTANAATENLAAGDGKVSASKNDVLTATIVGCGPNAASTSILIDPAGVVFDTRTDQPIPGVTVTLIDVSGNGNGGHPGELATVLATDGVSSSPSTVTTDAEGRFEFPLVAPSTYRLMLTPVNGFSFPSQTPPSLMPADRNIDPTGSFGGNFQVSADISTVMLDVPMDSGDLAGLFVDKKASRNYAEIGDFIDYVVTIKNNTGYRLPQVSVHDTLPVGFAYQLGSARLEQNTIADPIGSNSRDLAFAVGDLDQGAQATLTYRVQIRPTAIDGDGVNKAVATSDRAESNIASAKVVVSSGVFSDRGFVTGKVFADCNGSGLQDDHEVGIPGVRIFMDDGTYVITDAEGKYSLYGVTPRLHVLRIDPSTLPTGARPSYLFNRDAGDGSSRFVDIRDGELFRADFPMNACTPQMHAEVSRRRRNVALETDEGERVLKAQFLPERAARSISETQSLPASGVIGGAAANRAVPAGEPEKSSIGMAADAMHAASAVNAAPANAVLPQPVATEPGADTYVPTDGKLAFVDLKDQDVLPFAQTNIRVKGNSAASLYLKVNGQAVPVSRVGKKSIYSAKQVAVWEYIGVTLKPGSNEVQVDEIDPFGNSRGTSTIHLIAPNKLGKLRIDLPETAFADGNTPVQVRVRLTDADGVPVTVRTPVTLDSTVGQWLVKDADDKEPGVQVFIEGGYGYFDLLPPHEPGETTIRAFSGTQSAEAKFSFLPELRPMIAVGSTEQVLSFNHQSGGDSPLRGFQSQLDRISAGDPAKTSFSSRTGLMMKGKIGDKSLLTMAYDSERSRNELLFRDILPDDYYPVYGDSSVRGYEAQSTSPLYVRVDRGKSFLLMGDYTTQDQNNPARMISNYSRSMTGLRQHFENGRYNFTAYGSHESASQGVEELRANGTSGPFLLSRNNIRPQSEKVEIVTRDRNQPAVVVDIVSQQRFSDYQFDSITGELLMKGPVASFDANLNPNYIRVTYEYDQGGPKFWVAGAEGQIKVNERLSFGGVFVSDENPENRSQLRGVNTTVRLGEKTQFVAEMAQTQRDLTGTGNGYHAEFKHEGDRLKSRIFGGRTDLDFDNISALLNRGRGESGAQISYKLDDKTRLVGDALYSEDVSTSTGTRLGALFGMERSFDNNMRMELGVRHSENPNGVTDPAQASAASNTNLRGKISMQLPKLPRFSVFTEYEQDVQNIDNRMLAVGGAYQLTDRGRIYLRHELISSVGSVYDLNTNQQLGATVIGVDANYTRDAHIFSEFRGNDAFSGRETEAALGLRNSWKLAEGLRANTTLENIHVLSGANTDNSIAVTGGLEYTANPVWKGSARLEMRGSTSSNSMLSTAGMAAKISDSWTFLGRGLLSHTTLKGSLAGARNQNRLQWGFAYRDTDTNRWSVLSMAELKSESDRTNSVLPTSNRVLVFSTNVNYQPAAYMVLTGRYAAKLLNDQSTGLDSNSKTHLLSTRMMLDVSKRWDVGLASSSIFSQDMHSRQYGVGGEIGYRVARNLWLSGGYNVLGYQDVDLAGGDTTRKGAYIRLRFKFDESLFSRHSEPQMAQAAAR
jgi:uncharacterized repeat protein (TIGR01451 family)